MPRNNRMTDERFASLAAAVHDGTHGAENAQKFVDFNVFVEVFNELKAMREERK